MKIYRRILAYLGPYRSRFLMGIFLSLLLSVFNGLSLAALKPIFDILGAGDERPYQLQFSESELKSLAVLERQNELRQLYRLSARSERELDLAEKVFSAPPEKTAFGRLQAPLAEGKLWINQQVVKIHPFKLLFWVAVFILPVYLLKLASMLGTVYFITSTGLMAVRDMRRDLYRRLLALPLSHFVQEKTGVLMSRIINDAGIVSDSISENLRISINNFFIIVTHLILLAIINYKLLLISVVGVPLLLWPVSYLARKIKSLTNGEQTQLADMHGHLQEVISSIRVIRAFSMENYELSRFDQINQSLYQQGFKYRFTHFFGPALVEFTTSFIVSGLIVYGGYQILNGEISAGSFFTFLFTLMVILSPIKQMATWYNIVHRTEAAGERIFEIMAMPTEVTEPEKPQALPLLKNSIDFEGVSFGYSPQGPLVLHDINMRVPVGSMVALVGHSGAGKSTLVDLIPRFYDVSAGKITMDGIDIRQAGSQELRAKIAIVTQEIILFNGTIRENISFGRADISDEQIERAAALAYADEFIDKLPLRYDTRIGERGLLLSGGQRQRISIARALLKDPEILILDEATSALDTQSERLVQKALEELMRHRTTFVIAHRLSTIYRADQILVMDAGKIVERGSHEELLARGGLYQDFYNLQFSKEHGYSEEQGHS